MDWSIKAQESTSAVETVPEGQPAYVNDTKKGLAEHFEDGILTPSAGGGISCDYPSALMDPEFDVPDIAEAVALLDHDRDRAPAVSVYVVQPR